MAPPQPHPPPKSLSLCKPRSQWQPGSRSGADMRTDTKKVVTRMRSQSPGKMPLCSLQPPALPIQPKVLHPGEAGTACIHSFIHSTWRTFQWQAPLWALQDRTSPSHAVSLFYCFQASKGHSPFAYPGTVLGCRVAAEWAPHLLLSSLPEAQAPGAP